MAMKVLLVDADPDFLEQAATFLEKEVGEFDVETAVSPEKGLELMSENDYAAVVSAYQMSEMDGLEFLKIVREEKQSDISFIVFTGRGREEVAMKALNLGADRYLQRGGDASSNFDVLSDAILQEINHSGSEKGLKEWENENKYRSLIENLNEIVYILNENAEIEYISPNIEEISGYSPSELVGKSYTEFIHPDDIEGRIKQFEKVLSGDGEPSEYRFITKEGDVRWVRTNANPIIEEGKTVGIQGILTDITDLKKLEEEIKHRENLERIITEISADLLKAGMEEIDESINKALKKIGEFVDADRSYIFQFYDSLEMMKNTHEWCAEGVSLHKDNLQNMSTDSFSWWMEKLKKFENILIPKVSELPPQAEAEKETLQAQNIKSLIVLPMISSGSLLGYIGLDWVEKEEKWSEEIIDLLRIAGETIASALDRKKMEENLREAQDRLSDGIKRYRNLTEASPDTILLIDSETKEIIDANSKAEDLFKISREDIIGEDFSEFRPQEEAEKYDDIISSETEISVKESLLIDGNGDEVPVEVGASNINFRGRDVTYGVFRDISERKKAQEREELIHSILRHDLRNKLQIMQGYHDMLKDIDLSEHGEEYLSMAEEGTTEGIEIIEKVRNLRKAQEEQTKRLQIRPVLREAIQKARRIGKEEDMEIEASLLGEEYLVNGGSLLIQVFSNILENAISHSEGDYIRVREEVSEDEILCIIEDNGKGLSDEEKNKVFEKGYTTDEERGTGLGMFLVKTLLEVYGGSIEVKDSDLGGARFDIKLQRI